MNKNNHLKGDGGLLSGWFYYTSHSKHFHSMNIIGKQIV